MGGLGVMILVGLYIWAAYVLVRRSKPRWGKALVAAIFLLVPTADAVYGRIRLKQMCAESGLKIYKTVEGVDGFLDHMRPLEDVLTRYGFEFVEGRDLSGRIARISRSQDGKVLVEKDVTPKSSYRYEVSSAELGRGYVAGEHRIRDLRTNEVLARALNYSYEGGWAERFLARFTGSGSAYAGSCHEGAAGSWRGQIIRETLKPPKK
jgi:hypothetical protein